MHSSDKFWLLFWVIITSFILAIIFGTQKYDHEQTKAMTEAGLQECHYDFPSHVATVWQRECTQYK